MQVFRDPKDPSGMGMFSKTGRFTTEAFYILRKKDDILNAEKKKIWIPRFRASNKMVRMLIKYLKERVYG